MTDVVLPCLDGAAALPWVLSRILDGYRPIVVDNGCTDGSPEIAARLGATVVHAPVRGFGAAPRVHGGRSNVIGTVRGTHRAGPESGPRAMNAQPLVIAKAPVPGRVKTRLCPPCTPRQAALVAAAALADHTALRVVETWTEAQRWFARVSKP